MGWRVVNCLNILNEQIRTMCPNAVPPNTPASAWGTIADAAHDPTSDHAVHTYPGLLDVVCARDFPHAPDKGIDGAVITEQLRLSRDPRIGYVIFNGRIFSGHVVDGVPAYTWRTYTGSDQHKEHFHVSSVHTTLADSTERWDIGMADWTDKQIADVVYTLVTNPKGAIHARISGLEDKLNAVSENVQALLSRPTSGVDTHALAQEVATLVGTENADAIADLLAQRLSA